MKKFVIISGNIGSGKSSLTELLSKQLGWKAFYEVVEDNPYLEDFYYDMKKWSFHLQVFFLSKRFKHHQNIVNDPCSVVQDRSIYEDVDIFARNLYEQGLMEARDYHNYSELFEIMVDFLTPPSLIVYLQASVDTLLQRISLRGRDYEQKISQEYLLQLNTLYEKWVKEFSLCPILEIATDGLDFVQEPGHLKFVIEKILAKLQLIEKTFSN
jgi:deoxyadenosine/deoxycytidine kinase